MQQKASGRPLAARAAGVLAPTLRYLMQTEVHVFAFSISAGILLSFFPFMTLMLSLCRYVFKWKASVNAINFALGDYFPDVFGQFLRRNLEATVESRGPVQIVSLILLLFTSSGIFEPLEVAFNRAWRCASNRSYWKNQLLSLGLMFACGGLILLSITLTAVDNDYLRSSTHRAIAPAASLLAYKVAAIPSSMLLLFLMYWLLPNCKVSASKLVLPSILVGLLLEGLKYVNLITWPYLRAKLALEYGPFVYSITIILWGFLAAMLVLAGADWSARRSRFEPAPLASVP